MLRAIFLFLLAIFSSIQAQAAPRAPFDLSQIDGMKLRLVSTDISAMDGLGAKTINLTVDGALVMARWFSPVRHLAGGDPWPVYKVSLVRGVLQTQDLELKIAFIHPHFWVEGVAHLERESFLWFPPDLLSSLSNGSVKEVSFPIDFNLPATTSTQGPRDLLEKVAIFNILLQKPIVDSQMNQERENFIKEFQSVRILSPDTNVSMVVNGTKTEVKAVELGNRFVHFVVLKESTNPLVLALRFDAPKGPEEVAPFLAYFKKHMGFQITQIQTPNFQ